MDTKTVNRVLSAEQWADYKVRFDYASKLRALVAEPETLALQIFGEDDRW